MEPKKQSEMKYIHNFTYSKERLLGKGSFGEVYLGFDQANHTPVAIKTISSLKASQANIDENALAVKIVSELSNMQIARSDRLVKLISPHRSKNNIYLVCEYCNGGSLKDYLNHKGKLAESETMHFFKDLLEGFRVLHQKKIVHRDMKPANLLIHNHRLKIGDLGFSKSLQVHEQVLTSIVGSPLYMSPQILSNSTYTEKTDIWSVGVLLYEMLLGEAPWKVNSLQEIKQKVAHKPEFPKNCTISESTRYLILSMLEYEEKKRVGWEVLFREYLSPLSSSMEEESSPLLEKLREVNQHFQISIAIEAENHVIYMLIRNNRPHFDPAQDCKQAAEYFAKLKKIQHESQLLAPVVDHFVQTRNKTAYLMRLFMQVYNRSTEITLLEMFTTMLMILKYCIANTEELLGFDYESIEHGDLVRDSYYFRNFRELLAVDLQILKQLLRLYMGNMFVPQMKELYKKEERAVTEIEKNLKDFFREESVSIKYTEFWLKNEYRQVFNAVKNEQNLPEKWFLVTRMIYELEKSLKTNLFANMGQKSNMAKKLETWAREEKWKTKIKQLKKYELQNFTTFINKQMNMSLLSNFLNRTINPTGLLF